MEYLEKLIADYQMVTKNIGNIFIYINFMFIILVVPIVQQHLVKYHNETIISLSFALPFLKQNKRKRYIENSPEGITPELVRNMSDRDFVGYVILFKQR